MALIEKVRAVEEVFLELDTHIRDFQSWSSLACKTGCGQCCLKPNVQATILEFLPLAHYLFENDQAIAWLDRLEQDAPDICVMINPFRGDAGLCGEYQHRGMICRLFGFSARRNKYSVKELITCQVIKSEQGGAVTTAQAGIAQGAEIPVASHYYTRLLAIDDLLARDLYPINVAIKKALETVLNYYAYRSKCV